MALVGGLAAPLLFLAFGLTALLPARPLRRGLLVGTLVGLEIPLLLRILREPLAFKELVARVLTFDYLGALARRCSSRSCSCRSWGSCARRCSSAWPTRWSACGRPGSSGRCWPPSASLRVLGRRSSMLAPWARASYADRLTAWPRSLYADNVVLAADHAVPAHRDHARPRDFQLFLNGNLQFSSRGRVPLPRGAGAPGPGARCPAARRVLVLGGGDGLAVREILRTRACERSCWWTSTRR